MTRWLPIFCWIIDERWLRKFCLLFEKKLIRDDEPGEPGQLRPGELFMLLEGSCDSHIDSLFEFILNCEAI